MIDVLVLPAHTYIHTDAIDWSGRRMQETALPVGRNGLSEVRGSQIQRYYLVGVEWPASCGLAGDGVNVG